MTAFAIRHALVSAALVFSLSTAHCNTPEKLNALLCCLPEIPVPDDLTYENVFRIAIVEFLDAHNFCVGRVKRSCIHFGFFSRICG